MISLRPSVDRPLRLAARRPSDLSGHRKFLTCGIRRKRPARIDDLSDDLKDSDLDDSDPRLRRPIDRLLSRYFQTAPGTVQALSLAQRLYKLARQPSLN